MKTLKSGKNAGCFVYYFQIGFQCDGYGWLNSWLIKTGLVSSPIYFLTDPKTVMKVIIPVCLWTSMGAGFLSFVAGLKGIDKSQYEAGYIDGALLSEMLNYLVAYCCC